MRNSRQGDGHAHVMRQCVDLQRWAWSRSGPGLVVVVLRVQGAGVETRPGLDGSGIELHLVLVYAKVRDQTILRGLELASVEGCHLLRDSRHGWQLLAGGALLLEFFA